MRAAALSRPRRHADRKADTLPYLERGELVRLLPSWWVDAGPISLYYARKNLLHAKTKVFIDFVVEVFQRERYLERFAGSLGDIARCGESHSLLGDAPIQRTGNPATSRSVDPRTWPWLPAANLIHTILYSRDSHRAPV